MTEVIDYGSSWLFNISDILHIISSLGYSIDHKIVDNQYNYTKLINLTNGYELCQKCNGTGNIRLYEYDSKIPYLWCTCKYCNRSGIINFIDRIKQGF